MYRVSLVYLSYIYRKNIVVVGVRTAVGLRPPVTSDCGVLIFLHFQGANLCSPYKVCSTCKVLRFVNFYTTKNNK